ncbi:unnamed protein product [Closterium sp. Naga37s-1]|nr:unnamed protein product [Closterium sp. Naga37s-1]
MPYEPLPSFFPIALDEVEEEDVVAPPAMPYVPTSVPTPPPPSVYPRVVPPAPPSSSSPPLASPPPPILPSPLPPSIPPTPAPPSSSSSTAPPVGEGGIVVPPSMVITDGQRLVTEQLQDESSMDGVQQSGGMEIGEQQIEVQQSGELQIGEEQIGDQQMVDQQPGEQQTGEPQTGEQEMWGIRDGGRVLVSGTTTAPLRRSTRITRGVPPDSGRSAPPLPKISVRENYIWCFGRPAGICSSSFSLLRLPLSRRILDDPSLPKISVRAAYIMVFGRLTAGEPDKHFSNRVTFTLFQNFKQQRASYALQFYKPSDPNNPRDLGHKTFAVVGGQVALYGMPGGGNTPSWVRLTETADAGARAIYVNADVTRWAPGMTVALASTSANLNDAEHHVITSVSVVTPASGPGKSDGRYKINLKTALKKRHDGVKISDGVGGTVGIYGEVALLDRHIVITGSDEPAPHHYDAASLTMLPPAQKIPGEPPLPCSPSLPNPSPSLPTPPPPVPLPAPSRSPPLALFDALSLSIAPLPTFQLATPFSLLSLPLPPLCSLSHPCSPAPSPIRFLFPLSPPCSPSLSPLPFPPLPSPPPSPLPFPISASLPPLRFPSPSPFPYPLSVPLPPLHFPTPSPLPYPLSISLPPLCSPSPIESHQLAHSPPPFVPSSPFSLPISFWLEANPYMRVLSKLLPGIGSTVPFCYNWGTWDGKATMPTPTPSLDSAPTRTGSGRTTRLHFWLEANPYMRGLSKLLPDIGSTVPFYYNWGTWDGNQAHSNALFGFRTYPHGSRPHYPSPSKNPRVSLKNFLVYRNKAGERLIVENGVFLDNGIGIDLSRNAGVQAKGCRFIGRSSSSCSSSNAVTTTTALATTTATTQDTSNGSDGSIPSDGTVTDNSTAANAPTPPPGNDSTATTPPNAPDNSTLPGNDSTGAGGDGAPPNDPDSPVPAGPTTLWQPFTLQASLGPLDPYADDGSTDSSSGDSGSSNTSSSSSSSSSGNKALENAGMAGPAQGSPSGVVDPMGPSMQDQAGSYAAPIGIALSQSNPQDHLYPNSIQDSSFHRFGTCSSSSLLFLILPLPSPLCAPILPFPSFHHFGTCSSSSFGIALVANRAGGYWNTAMFVKSSGTPPRGGLVARFYAIRDVDGSLLGQSGYAVANYDPILPPAAVRAAKCDYKSALSAYSCTSVCYRSVGLEYDEYGATSSTVLRPYSYLKITRMDDGTFFHAYGTDNDDPKRKPSSSKRRFLTASLLAGYTYRIQIIAADTNSDFYPSKMQLNVFDWQGCSGSVRVVIDSPNSSSKWRADVPTVPCSAANETKVYKEYACGEGKSRLRLDIGASSSGKAAVVMELNQGVSTSCSLDSGCSSITSAALPPLSIAPLVDSESAFSSTDPFFDPGFYAGGAVDPHTVL